MRIKTTMELALIFASLVDEERRILTDQRASSDGNFSLYTYHDYEEVNWVILILVAFKYL